METETRYEMLPIVVEREMKVTSIKVLNMGKLLWRRNICAVGRVFRA